MPIYSSDISVRKSFSWKSFPFPNLDSFVICPQKSMLLPFWPIIHLFVWLFDWYLSSQIDYKLQWARSMEIQLMIVSSASRRKPGNSFWMNRCYMTKLIEHWETYLISRLPYCQEKKTCKNIFKDKCCMPLQKKKKQ